MGRKHGLMLYTIIFETFPELNRRLLQRYSVYVVILECLIHTLCHLIFKITTAKLQMHMVKLFHLFKAFYGISFLSTNYSNAESDQNSNRYATCVLTS